MSETTPMSGRDMLVSTSVIDDYEQQIEDLTNRVNNLAADLLEARAQLNRAREARTNEVATFRQLLTEVERQRAQALHDLAMSNAELESVRDDRDEYRHGVRTYASYASRYKLAWQSARQRASNHLDALVDADDERDALRALVQVYREQAEAARQVRS